MPQLHPVWSLRTVSSEQITFMRWTLHYNSKFMNQNITDALIITARFDFSLIDFKRLQTDTLYGNHFEYCWIGKVQVHKHIIKCSPHSC
mgnify:FL=1